jgi:hypothetical protein
MKLPITNRHRIWSALACLLAVGLVYTPFAAAAWNAHVAACCTGDQCPIREHHHAKAPVHAADCEHQGDAMVGCSMSCCESSERALLAPLTFVLPAAEPLTWPVLVAATAPQLHTGNLVRSLKVLSPPPRFDSSSL